MLSQCLVPSITKKVNSYSLVLEQEPLIVFQYILKSIKTFKFKTISTVMPKNINNNNKKTETNFDLTTDS